MAKNKNGVASIVTYDPYMQTSYAFSGNKISQIDLSKANKNNFFISYIKGMRFSKINIYLKYLILLFF